MIKNAAAVLIASGIVFAWPAQSIEAKVVRLVVERTAPYAGGKAFGDGRELRGVECSPDADQLCLPPADVHGAQDVLETLRGDPCRMLEPTPDRREALRELTQEDIDALPFEDDVIDLARRTAEGSRHGDEESPDQDRSNGPVSHRGHRLAARSVKRISAWRQWNRRFAR